MDWGGPIFLHMTWTADHWDGELDERGLAVDTWDVETFDTVDSTNRMLLDLAAEGEAAGKVLAARHQSAGRGRRGRVWDSKPDASLLFSMLFGPPSNHFLPLYGQAVGLAVVDACHAVGGFEAQLKWPNDVLVGERKLAGILAETVTEGDRVAVVVGCGINLNWDGELPEALPNAISADEAAGQRIDFDAMLHAILSALGERLVAASDITNAYRQKCSTIGKDVRVQREEGDLLGRATDVTETGALVVEADGVLHQLTVGEVVHLRLA